MKSISLANIQKYLVSLTPETLELFRKNEDEFRQMWVDQGSTFWVKFVVCFRKFVLNTSSKYDEKCEKEFINFLKALTFKNFKELDTYFRIAGKAREERMILYSKVETSDDTIRTVTASEVENYSQMRALTIKLKCAGAFVQLLNAWKEARAGNEFNFTPPESWFMPVDTAEPFESYIRAKWGGYRNVDDILGCKRSELGWWAAPARKVDQSQVSMPSTSQTQPKSQKPIPQKKNVSNKVRKDNRKNIIPKENSKKVPKWLPNPNHISLFNFRPFTPNQHNLMIDLLLSKLHPLLEYSIFPLLQRKFHTIDANALAEDTDKNSLAVAPWYVMCLEAFGNTYMSFIRDCHEDIKDQIHGDPSIRKKGRIQKWLHNRDDDRKVLETVRDRIGAPNEEKHSVEKPQDFLLEPCVLIQLPWQPVILRQWLSVALIEILKFELESVEFRHWPVSIEAEPAARDLLSLIIDLKERILLGWTVMSYDTSMYPVRDTRHCSFIMDQVVLPSLATLEFLCSGEPIRMLRSLKHHMWKEPKQEVKGKVNISRSSFLTNGNLAGFYILFYGNALYWNTVNQCTDPFPTINHKNNAGLFLQLYEIENQKKIFPPDYTVPFECNVLSIEEKRLHILTQHAAIFSGQDYRNNMDKVIQTAREVVIKCKHFSPQKLNYLLEVLNGRVAQEIYPVIQTSLSPDTLGPLEHLILSSVFYYDLGRYSESIKDDTSIMGVMNRLTAAVMEREQLIRIIASCAVILEECPKVCGTISGKCAAECVIDKTPPMDTSEIIGAIKYVKEKKMQIETREYLWSCFPDEWRKPVISENIMPTLEDGIPAIVTALENRVGRIVWNVAQQNFLKCDQGRGTYLDAHIVQYMLPCYIAMLVDTKKLPESDRNTVRKQNLIKFLTGLVEHYEKDYFKWSEGTEKRAIKIIDDVADKDLRISCVLSNYLIERTSYALHGFAGLGRMGEPLDSMPHFNHIGQCMLEFPMFNSSDYTSNIEYFNSSAWLNFAYPHIRVLHDVCFQVLPIPTPDMNLYCHELQDFYFASALLQQLEVHYSLSDWITLPFRGMETPAHDTYTSMTKPLRLWRYELFSIVFETEGKFDYPQNMVQVFIEGKGKSIVEMLFHAMKSARDYMKTVSTPMFEFNFTIPTWGTVELKNNFDAFISGNMKTLPLFEKKTQIVPSQKVVQPSPSKSGTKLAKCNNCHRVETEVGTFTKCKACMEQKYPYPNYFCSVRCQEQWWNTEHMAEHLEFDLGLCDFADLKISD